MAKNTDYSEKKQNQEYWMKLAVKQGLPARIGYYAWLIYGGCGGAEDVLPDVKKVQNDAFKAGIRHNSKKLRAVNRENKGLRHLAKLDRERIAQLEKEKSEGWKHATLQLDSKDKLWDKIRKLEKELAGHTTCGKCGKKIIPIKWYHDENYEGGEHDAAPKKK